MGDSAKPDPLSPIVEVESDAGGRKLESGIALCLSGGGYRAMVFHIGVLWRLNELGYLKKLKRISSVSGGSITAGVLGMRWTDLQFDANGVAAKLHECVVVPLLAMASRTIDAESIFGGLIAPGSISDRIAEAYDSQLFHGATLQDLPDDPPRFVINATNVQSGALWRFMKPAMRDYKVGAVPNPTVPLAVAVAASSAFPPVLSPLTLELDPGDYSKDEATKGTLHREPFLSRVFLTDGGVYDNLGLETAWKRFDTVLVSDAGGQMSPEEEPKRDWARHSIRILDVIDNQVRSLRKRQLIESFRNGARKGTYFGIRSSIDDYPATEKLPCPHDATMELAAIKTRLKRLDSRSQERLINWGYAVCDAGMRSHVDPTLAGPAGFPYPTAQV